MSQFDNLLQTNPLLKDWSGKPYGFAPFDEIKAEHFEPALKFSMEKHIQEVHGIVSNSEAPTFENSISILDRAGALFTKVSETFDNLCSSLGTPDFQEVELKMAGPLASHYNKIATLPGLFPRIDAVHAHRHNLGLNSEQIRLVERFHLDFVRAGAKFSSEMQERYSKIVEELAELSTKFSQNVTLDVNEVYMELRAEDNDMLGLPNDLVEAAKQAAVDRKKPDGTHLITLSRSLIEPFLIYSQRRDLREKGWKLWSKRGELVETRNNLVIAKRILELRLEKATMHGYPSYADYATADTMAGSPQRVLQLLEEVWGKAKTSVDSERKELENYIHECEGQKEGESLTIEPWDWRYYAEKVRIKNYDLNASEVKPFFPLNRMTGAIFDVAHQLFQLKFVENPSLPKYHPDVKVYEVFHEDPITKHSSLKAIFIADNYARPFKRGGAWMSHYRSQHRNSGPGHAQESILPIIVNNNNFNKPSGEEACLLSFDDATTLFHEFGHGLHGMLSNVTYQRLAGTSVLRDFVELPSQLYEHWLSESVVLQKHARHYQTNEVIPEQLLSKLMKSRRFNQGFQTIEYSASALVDAKLHLVTKDLANLDLTQFEKDTLNGLGMPQGIIMRHRLPHFERKKFFEIFLFIFLIRFRFHLMFRFILW
jgi:peptidyl-dipeptidase Dcp